MTETTPLADTVSGWSRYRKKPVAIEAMQLVGTNAETHAVYQWIESNTLGSFDPLSEEIPASGVSIDPATGFFLIATLEGVMQAKYGDWIIRGVQGEFYPIKDSIFRETYEPAGGGGSRDAPRCARQGRYARPAPARPRTPPTRLAHRRPGRPARRTR